MNYFELFEIPIALKIDSNQLKKTFYSLSKKYHPDLAGLLAADQENALEKSALINKAWKTFQQPDETIKYTLQLNGLLEEEEKYELPSDFLMEMLEINEQLMDADEPDLLHAVEIKLNDFETAIYNPIQETLENYQHDITANEKLLQVKEYYFKKKYLTRIRMQLKGKP